VGKGMKKRNADKPRLSVLLVTYNQQAYISQALGSILGQSFDGNIELVIADDASTDNTLAVISEFEGRDSRFQFKYLDKVNNLGITKNYQHGFAACTGEYVAVMEGDDYWVSPFKLQRQMDFLDTHWECNLCAVNYFVFEEERQLMYPRTNIGNAHRLLSAREQIADNLASNFSTCMYRKSALDALPCDLFRIRSYDWIVNICVAQKSMIGFLEEPMSVYRLHSKGVWTQMSHIEQLEEQLELIPAYDKLTGYIYHSEFELLSNRLQSMLVVPNITENVFAGIQPENSFFKNIQLSLFRLLRKWVPSKLKRLFIKAFHRRVA